MQWTHRDTMGHDGTQCGDTQDPQTPTHLRGPQPLHAALQRLPQPAAQLLDALHLQGAAVSSGGVAGWDPWGGGARTPPPPGTPMMQCCPSAAGGTPPLIQDCPSNIRTPPLIQDRPSNIRTPPLIQDPSSNKGPPSPLTSVLPL